MGVIFVSPTATVARETPRHIPALSMWLESLDDSIHVPLSGGPVWRANGAVGLSRPPQDLAISGSPGVDGGTLDEIATLTRPILLPLAVVTDTQEQSWEALAKLRRLVRHSTVTADGTFRLVCQSAATEREFTVAYVSGLEGRETGRPDYTEVPLQLVALDPYARDRETRTIEFRLAETAANAWPWTWPGALGTSTVIGEDMPVEVLSDVPVWPRLDFTGPLDPLTVESSTGMSLDVPDGVPAGSTLTIVTDPRAKSIRLDGALAAGRIARGSRLGSPFVPGTNLLSVVAPGADSSSRVTISWRGGWDSLW